MIKSTYKKFNNFGFWLSDRISSFGGSWAYICYFLLLSIIYMAVNVYIHNSFDPYPFTFLNLLLGFMASLQAPFIMMSDNRQNIKDRKQADLDLQIDKDTQILIVGIVKEIKEIKRMLKKEDR